MRLTVRMHLGQLRLATIEAIRILNELVAESADARAA